MKRSKPNWLPIPIAATAVAGLTLVVQLTGFFQHLEWATYDRLFCLRPLEPRDDRLLVVTVDEADIHHLGQWPLSDATLTQLVQTLSQYQPAAMGLDLYRDLPVEPGHQAWVEVMKSTPNLIGVEKGIGSLVGPPAVLSQHDRVALADIILDADSKVRRALLTHHTRDGLKFSLGTKLALMYLQQQGITPEEIDPTRKQYRLGDESFFPFRSNDGGYIRTNAGGYQILLNYRGQKDRFRTVSLRQVLAHQIPPHWVSDRIVLIGSIAPSLHDLFYTPYSSPFFNQPQATSGVIVHANLASQILSAALDGRPPIRVWREPWDWGWILLWSFIGATASWQWFALDFQHQKTATKRVVLTISLGAIGCLPFAIGYGAFLASWWVPVVAPLVALTASATAIASTRIRRLQQQRWELEQGKIQADAASKAKSQFLANMSHELRTPLNAILGFTQLMSRDTQLNGKQQEYLAIVNRSGEHLLELINEVLDFSKIEAGVISFHGTSFDLYGLLDDLEALFQLKAARKGLQFRVEVQPDVPKTIKTDRKKLRCCCINLVGNAIKFTHQGRVTLGVSVTGETEIGDRWQRAEGRFSPGWEDKEEGRKMGKDPKDPKEGRSSLVPRQNSEFPLVPFSPCPPLSPTSLSLTFKVEDTGSGIAPEELHGLFQPFMQTQTGQTATEGTGLGLTITQKFVQVLGGKIGVTSELGQGTTFEFQIPIEPGEASQVRLLSSQRVIGLEAGQPQFRILVVDDIPENRLLLVRLLEAIGFEVREATNGREGLASWDSWHPHLIWMDTRMPVMDGLEATRQIRVLEKRALSGETRRGDGLKVTEVRGQKANKGQNTEDLGLSPSPQTEYNGQQTVIIALTASAFENRREEILRSGCDDFVHKPFQDATILDKMAQYLGVRYRYEELPQPSPSKLNLTSMGPLDSFLLPQLSAMPPTWLRSLLSAANEANEVLVWTLIEQIPSDRAQLACGLRGLAHDFRLDVILRLTQLAIQEGSPSKGSVISN